ncbi:Striatin-4, partial [Physocladia obscura]
MDNLTLPSVLHFLNTEWRRFERERNEWAIEREGFRAQVSQLLGEKRGLENLNADLATRNQMLEYAVRAERLRHQQADGNSSNTANNDNANIISSSSNNNSEALDLVATVPVSALEPRPNDINTKIPANTNPNTNSVNSSVSVVPVVASSSESVLEQQQQQQQLQTESQLPPQSVLQFSKGFAHARSREIMKNYLREANHLLAHSSIPASVPTSIPSRPVFSTFASTVSTSSASPSPVSATNDNDDSSSSNNNNSNNNFVNGISNGNDGNSDANGELRFRVKGAVSLLNASGFAADDISNIGATTVKRKIQKRINNTDSINHIDKTNAPNVTDLDEIEGLNGYRFLPVSPKNQGIGAPAYGNGVDDDINDDVLVPDLEHQQRIWKPKATLNRYANVELAGKFDYLSNKVKYSHLDSVRAIAFLPNKRTSNQKTALISCSEDGTAKLWALDSLYSNDSANNNSSGSNGSRSHRKALSKSELEPVFTFRGHVGPVTALAITNDGEGFYTGGSDSSVRFWGLGDVDNGYLLDRETYASYDQNPQKQIIVSHTDTVWDMQLNDFIAPTQPRLATASADGTVKIFDASDRLSHRLLTTLIGDGDSDANNLASNGSPTAMANPTSVAWLTTGSDAGRKIAVSYQNSKCRVFDIETGQIIIDMQSWKTY